MFLDVVESALGEPSFCDTMEGNGFPEEGGGTETKARRRLEGQITDGLRRELEIKGVWVITKDVDEDMTDNCGGKNGRARKDDGFFYSSTIQYDTRILYITNER